MWICWRVGVWERAKAMADHQMDERLQMFGVAALDNLSYTGLMPLEHNASHLGDVAGSSPLSMASRVAIAMKTHPTEKMLELGCRAMANLAQEGEIEIDVNALEEQPPTRSSVGLRRG